MTRELLHVKRRTVTEHIRAHLMNQCPMIEPRHATTLEDCRRQDAPKQVFVRHMLARTLMGRVRYGAPCVVPGAIDKAIELIRDYLACGNTELLVDAANYLSIEFLHPNVEGAAFSPIDRT